MTAYIALLRKQTDSDYGVDFPDFPGCVTAGTDLEDARRLAVEALALHVHGLQQDGAMLPEPSGLEAIMSDPENRDAIGFLVDAPAAVADAVQVNVLLPEDLLQEIDRASPNRSRFLADAAREKLRAA